jgi:hypothetical protein
MHYFPIICSLLLVFSCKAQSPVVSFEKNSMVLSSNSKATLDSIASKINSDDFMRKKVIFDVFGYFTPEESEHNRFIGICRSKVVIDYLVEQWAFPRSKWRIVDLDTRSPAYRPTSSVAVTTGHINP